MGGHRVKNRKPMSWSDENEHIFIEILYEKVKSNALQCSTFMKDEWSKINETMIVATKVDYGMDYGIDRLNGKWNLLHKLEEERQLEDFLNREEHVHVENDDEVTEVSNTGWRGKIGTSDKRRRKEPKISKSDKLEACMAQ
ncbi:Uncharacterized protein Adt_21994 [Abeliophyllum distichum]|uniref:Myb/SANT-like domain-containing protein n=1 Tax=Abeliophyllum distichum TaxID=126358 RepID=A0ABD1T1E7_9LAMI